MHVRAIFRIAGSAALVLLVCLGAGKASAQQAIRIDGSTGVAPLVAALAKAYQAKQPGVAIEIGKGLGTKARIEALAAGTIDVAMASHGLAVDELTKGGMTVREIARTPVVFGVNASVPVATLNEEQICAIYAGARTNWKELGGPDLAIMPRTRPESEVDAEVVRDGVACLKGLKLTEAAKVMQRGGDMATELAAAPGAIGMTTATFAEQSGGKIRALALNGVAPDEANVRAGRYKLTREAFLVTKGAAAPALAGFLDFVRGAEGAAVIKANGAIPTAAPR
ncbi:MAG: substrate-binding domain-containing protein [Xanthobacteraceae bacterium]